MRLRFVMRGFLFRVMVEPVEGGARVGVARVGVARSAALWVCSGSHVPFFASSAVSKQQRSILVVLLHQPDKSHSQVLGPGHTTQT